MKRTFLLYALALLTPTLASAADHNLGELAKANKIEVFNRTLDQTRLIRQKPFSLMPPRVIALAGTRAGESREGPTKGRLRGRNKRAGGSGGMAFNGRT